MYHVLQVSFERAGEQRIEMLVYSDRDEAVDEYNRIKKNFKEISVTGCTEINQVSFH